MIFLQMSKCLDMLRTISEVLSSINKFILSPDMDYRKSEDGHFVIFMLYL